MDATAYTQRSDFNNIVLIIDEDRGVENLGRMTHRLEMCSGLDSVSEQGPRGPKLRTRFLEVVQMC